MTILGKLFPRQNVLDAYVPLKNRAVPSLGGFLFFVALILGAVIANLLGLVP